MLFVMFAEFVGVPTEETFAAHIEWLVPRFQDGTFLLSGGLDAVGDRPVSALAIIEAETREAGLAILDSEPLYRAGIVSHDLVPFTPRVRTTELDERLVGIEPLRVVARS